MPAYSFDLTEGVQLPQDSGYILLSSLSRRFPFLHANPDLQIAPVRGRRLSDSRFLQTDYSSKLHVRGITSEQAASISWAWMEIQDSPLPYLCLSGAHEVSLHPSTYLVSRLVILPGIIEADAFQAEVAKHVPEAKVRLGRRRTLHLKGRTFIGYAVHLEDLSSAASCNVQEHGVGKYTSMGCGVFYPGRAVQ
jgi:CRISPR-associated protein Cas6